MGESDVLGSECILTMNQNAVERRERAETTLLLIRLAYQCGYQCGYGNALNTVESLQKLELSELEKSLAGGRPNAAVKTPP